MATIQIRDIPEAVHRIYKARAAGAGQSLQEYLRNELIEGATLSPPAAVAAEVEAQISSGMPGYSEVSATNFIRHTRDSS